MTTTGTRRPGRPRSTAARSAVLAAASELLREGGLPAVTVEAVSARSGVGKPTIYRSWPNRTAVAIDAFAADMAAQVTLVDSGDARRDLIERVRQVAAFYATPAGAVLVQLMAATTTDPGAGERLRERFLAGRRAETTAMWQRAVARGEVRCEVSPDVAIDVLFSPIVYRLMLGYDPVDSSAATELAEAALDGLLIASRTGGRDAH